MPSVRFIDGTAAEYVRNAFQLHYHGIVYVYKGQPQTPLDFAHNAKARLEADGDIHILCERKTLHELVPIPSYVGNHDINPKISKKRKVANLLDA